RLRVVQGVHECRMWRARGGSNGSGNAVGGARANAVWLARNPARSPPYERPTHVGRNPDGGRKQDQSEETSGVYRLSAITEKPSLYSEKSLAARLRLDSSL